MPRRDHHVAAAGRAAQVSEQLELRERRQRRRDVGGCAGERGQGVPTVCDLAQQRSQPRLEMQHGALVAIDAHRDVERVGGVADDGGAVAQERIGARRAPRRDRAGDRTDVAADVGGDLGRNSEPKGARPRRRSSCAPARR